MITLFRTNQLYTLGDAKKSMIEQIRQLADAVALIGEPRKILRYEYVCEPVHLLHWLHNQHTEKKIYWSDRDNTFEIAGIEIAEEITGRSLSNPEKIFQSCETYLSADNPNLRFYGGFAFNEQSVGPEWARLGAYRFIVPQFELCRVRDETIFAFNIRLRDINEEAISQAVCRLEGINLSHGTQYRKVPEIISRKDNPERNDWGSIFKKITERQNDTSLKKIVLARQSVFSFDVAIRPCALVKHLKEETPDCFHFCIQTQPHYAFLGASPERLYKIEKDKLFTEAIAGTNPRGRTKAEDDRLQSALIGSDKNKLEHNFVVDALHEKLKILCSAYTHDENFDLLKLKGFQHLITRFAGTLNPEIYNETILPALHPTPAVAGSPSREALETIFALEPFQRGWYAGPVGYIGYDVSEFAVAIRSSLVDGNRISLYAGAGIVNGSSPDAEWEEIESKISRFMKVFKK